MRRYRLEIDNVRAHLRSLWAIISVQIVIIMALWFGWSQAPERLIVPETLVVLADELAQLAVEPLPHLPLGGDEGYGAVGRFAVAAAFDRTTVDVGGVVKLVLTITGEGNMEHLRVPNLDDVPGLHQLGKIETRDKNRVVVTYDMTPKTAEVSRVDGIAWNYFDTRTGKYVSLRTDPLSLTVRAIKGEKSLTDLPGEREKAVEAGVDDIFDVKLEGGSLGLGAAPSTGSALAFALAPWLLCLVGMMFWRARRRSLADVEGRRAKGAERKFEQALGAGEAPLDAFVAYLADRREFDPASWDEDQELAARAQVSERHAGHVGPVTKGSVVRRCVAGEIIAERSPRRGHGETRSARRLSRASRRSSR